MKKIVSAFLVCAALVADVNIHESDIRYPQNINAHSVADFTITELNCDTGDFSSKIENFQPLKEVLDKAVEKGEVIVLGDGNHGSKDIKDAFIMVMKYLASDPNHQVRVYAEIQYNAEMENIRDIDTLVIGDEFSQASKHMLSFLLNNNYKNLNVFAADHHEGHPAWDAALRNEDVPRALNWQEHFLGYMGERSQYRPDLVDTRTLTGFWADTFSQDSNNTSPFFRENFKEIYVNKKEVLINYLGHVLNISNIEFSDLALAARVANNIVEYGGGLGAGWYEGDIGDNLKYRLSQDDKVAQRIASDMLKNPDATHVIIYGAAHTDECRQDGVVSSMKRIFKERGEGRKIRGIAIDEEPENVAASLCQKNAQEEERGTIYSRERDQKCNKTHLFTNFGPR